jgi:YD repeat-containing protein
MNQTHTLKMLIIMMMVVLLTSCNEDEWMDISPSPVMVKFQNETMGISELVGPTDIILSFEKPATLSGIIILKMETDYADDFTTDPTPVNSKIEIPVTAGQSQVKFTLTPIHNQLYQGNKQVEFTIEAVPEGLAIGTKKVLFVTIYETDQPNLVNFMTQEGTLIEYTEEGFVVSIGLSLVALGEGSIEVGFANGGSLYGTYFTTEPAAVDGKINLAVESGMANLPIKFIPINNTTLNGHKEISLTITAATGAVSKGNNLTFKLLLIDDELMNKPKKFETNAYGRREMRVFEYNEMGKVSKIIWEQNELSGTDTYHYDQSGKLFKIVESPTIETRFQYDDQGRIILSERYQADLLKKYTIYTYNDAGKVGEAAVFNRKPLDEFEMSELFVYNYYYNSGSISKKLTYVPVLGKEDYILFREEAYSYFLYSPTNPFPMVEVLPGINVQKHYPSNFLYTENGQEHSYAYTYVFNDLGMPERRTRDIWEVTTYQYY